MVKVIQMVAMMALAASCGDLGQYEVPRKAPTQPEQSATIQSSQGNQGVDGSEQYLADALESTATTEAEVESTADVDEEVLTEIAGDRAKKLAGKVMADLDVDKSGSLTLEEFLAGPKKFEGKMPKLKISAELEAKRTAKMTEDFKASAGDDALLSVDELAALLKAKAPHVACVRGKGRGHKGMRGGPEGRGGRRGPPMHRHREPVEDGKVSELIKTFDKDSDGVLNAAEFKEFLNSHPGKPRMSQDVENESEQS